MSLQYLLDGYNIIHKMPLVVEGKLEDQRQHLIHFIESYRPEGSERNHVTIVFDGQPNMGGGSVCGRIKIIFSQGKTADEVIKKIVEESKFAKSIIVVTDDRDIQYSVRANGAKVQAVIEFLALARKTTKQSNEKRRKLSNSFSKCVGRVVESKITAELEDIWVKSKKFKA